MQLIQQIIAFCELTGQKPKQIPSSKLDRVFGKSAIGKQLRKDLLTTTNHYYNPETHVCKEYMINWPVYQELLAEYTQTKNSATPSIILTTESVSFDCVSRELELQFGEELSTGNFKYLRKGYRRYHSLQNLPKQKRAQVFAEYGYEWDYDITAAMPTLIKQYAVKNGLDIATPYYDELLQDRQRIRKQIANDLSITIPQAKILLTSLINGAKIGISNSHVNFAIHELLERDDAKIIMIKGSEELEIPPHEWIDGFRTDIKHIWNAIKQSNAITRKFKEIRYERINQITGEIHDINYMREMPISSKQKAMLYQKLEFDVMYYARNYLEELDIKYYQIHDGMMTDTQVNIIELSRYIEVRTGYEIIFEEQRVDSSTPVRGLSSPQGLDNHSAEAVSPSEYNRAEIDAYAYSRKDGGYISRYYRRPNKLPKDYVAPIVADDAPFFK